jgi:uncharacterized protein
MTGSQAFVAGVIAALLAGASAPGVAGSAPSFDCRRAKGFAETAICADPALATKDRAAARMYMGARSTMQEYGDSEETFDLKRERREWLALRDACETVACLHASYDARLRHLQDPADPRRLNEPLR